MRLCGKQYALCVALFLTFLVSDLSSAQAQQKSVPVMLANVYHPGVDLSDYWVSEKYDGIRAYWDGAQLHTRGGESINPPAWFVANWPNVPLDGELWAGRGNFAEAVSTARTQKPDDKAWRRMRFMVFDLPAYGGRFDQRLPALEKVVRTIGVSWVQVVRQERVPSHAALQEKLLAVGQSGGEGLMLHRGSSFYKAERNDDLLKMKLHDDAEARVLAHLPGKGRHQGRMGALLVEMPNGLRFRLGTGFSDAQRDHPPAIDSWVTYRYRGLHNSGLPRFASFVRIRTDLAPDGVKSRHP